MLTLFGYEISKKIAGYIIAAIAVMAFLIIYPRMDSIKEFFGFDTVRSLRAKNENLNGQVSQLDQTNKNNIKELEIVTKNYENTLKTLQKLNDENEQLKESSTLIDKQRRMALEELKRLSTTKGTTVTTSNAVTPFRGTTIDVTKAPSDVGISVIQMGSIWAKHCLITNYEGADCEPYKPVQREVE